VYVHVPFCRSKCSYCAFHSTVATPPASYADEVGAELRMHAPQGLALQTLYVGGGTPTALGTDGVAALCRVLRAAWLPDAPPPAEWTVEANPGTLSQGMTGQLRRAGVTRVSIGAQSFDPATLAVLGRCHDADAVRSAVAAAREAGIPRVGLDLIAGVPGLTPPVWRQTLEAALALEPDHLSVYALTVEPGTPLARAIDEGCIRMPDDDAQLDAIALAEGVLAERGYVRYEISNYAREGCECLHNLAVWRGEDYLGVGPAAASRRGLLRWTNAADLAAWRTALASGRRPLCEAETLTPEEDAAERLLTGLRLREGVCLEASEQGLRWTQRLAALAQLGVVERAPNRRWRLSARGREVADAVVRELSDGTRA
jgi:oxygen-independent coproporphyrinogen-3 oxidase